MDYRKSYKEGQVVEAWVIKQTFRGLDKPQKIKLKLSHIREKFLYGRRDTENYARLLSLKQDFFFTKKEAQDAYDKAIKDEIKKLNSDMKEAREEKEKDRKRYTGKELEQKLERWDERVKYYKESLKEFKLKHNV